MSGILQALLASIGLVKDAYFNLVTLLLPGNGTNGAQNNTFLDSSSNNFTITRNGNTTQGTFSPFSQTGWSNYLNGSSSLDVASNAALALGTGDFTYEIWLCDTATPPNSTNPSHVIGVNSSGGGVLRIYDTGIDFNTYAVGSPVTYSVTRAIGTWYHLAYTRSGTTGRLFYNGSLVATGTDSTNYSSSTNFIIGSNPTTGQFYTGYVSNARIVKGTALYTSSFTPSTTPLTAVSGTSLLTCQSNSFIDNSSNSLAITVRYSTPSVQAFSPFAPTAAYSAATNGGSGYFDGTGDYLTVANNAALQLSTANNFCIEAWIYPTALANADNGIISKRQSTVEWQFAVNGSAAGASNKQIYLYNNTTAYTSGTTIPGTNTWTHVAVTWDGTTLRFFINGTLCSNTYTSFSLPSASTNSVSIGANGSAETLSGYITDARIVKGSAVYTASFTPPTAPLTAITNTSLLCNFTNAGITDATAKNDLETVGNAQISTTQSKFGGSSMYFDGTNDYLLASDTSTGNFGSGDFTIEFWAYDLSRSSSGTVWSSKWSNTATVARSWIIAYVSSSTSLVFNISTDGSTQISLLSATVTPSLNTWNHIAVTRSGSTYRIFLNGVQEATATNSGTLYAATKPLCIGANYEDVQSSLNNFSVNGYIDDLRITKGYARYTANFTPPSAAFPVQ